MAKQEEKKAESARAVLEKSEGFFSRGSDRDHRVFIAEQFCYRVVHGADRVDGERSHDRRLSDGK